MQDLADARLTAPVAGLADPTRLELTVQVAEIDIPGIKSGRTVDVVIDTFPDQTLAGVISYPVTTLRSETIGDRWLVSSTAIQEVGGETVVTVVRGQERLPLAVTPEGLHGEWTIVRAAGLQAGDEVVGAIVPFGEE